MESEKKTVLVVAPPGAEREAICALLAGRFSPVAAGDLRAVRALPQLEEAGALIAPDDGDLTAGAGAAELWRSLALRDSLTGLWNRRGFLWRSGELLKGCENAALLYIDVDDFKAVNDSKGHAFGDEVLAYVGREVERIFRLGDAAARLAGDEFAVFLPGLPARVVAEKCACLCRSLGRGFRSRQGTACSLSCSVGAALYPAHGETVAQLLERADAALYAAKGRGKNGWAFYGEERD